MMFFEVVPEQYWMLLIALAGWAVLFRKLHLPTTSSKARCSVPCAPGWLPIIGHLANFISKTHMSTADAYFRWHQVGPMFQIFSGRQRVVVLSNIELIKQAGQRMAAVVSGHPEGIYHGYRGRCEGSLDYSFWATGNRWKMMRSATQPAFNSKIIQNYTGGMNRQAKKLIQELQQFKDTKGGEEDGSCDLSKFTFCLTWSIIEEALMNQTSGESWQPGTKGPQAHRRQLFENIVRKPLIANTGMFLRMILPKGIQEHVTLFFEYFPTQAERYQSKLFSGFHTYFKSIFNDARAQTESDRAPMIQNLLSLIEKARASPQYSNWFSDLKMLNTLTGFLIGGSDTTSFALAWAIHYMALDGKVRDHVLAEVNSFFQKHDNVSYENTKTDLPYCNAVIKETLRIQPPALLTTREVTQDVVLGGKSIPKGTWLHFDIWTLHRNPVNFPNPEQFQPERFLKGGEAQNKLENFMPFGVGNRICPGKDFAMAELVIVFARLVNELSFSVPAECEKNNVIRDQSVVSAYPKHGIRTRVFASEGDRLSDKAAPDDEFIKRTSASRNDFTSSWLWMISVWIFTFFQYWAGFPEWCPVTFEPFVAPYRGWALIGGVTGWHYSFIAFQLCHVGEAFYARHLSKQFGYSQRVCRLWFLQTLTCGLPSLHILLYRRFVAPARSKQAATYFSDEKEAGLDDYGTSQTALFHSSRSKIADKAATNCTATFR